MSKPKKVKTVKKLGEYTCQEMSCNKCPFRVCSIKSCTCFKRAETLNDGLDINMALGFITVEQYKKFKEQLKEVA